MTKADTRTRGDLMMEIEKLESRIDDLGAEYDALENEKDELENRLESISNPFDAIQTFLDECGRPCGSRKFTIPDNLRVHDAIRAMADAIGRNV